MKKITSLSMIVMAGTLLSACGSGGEENSSGGEDNVDYPTDTLTFTVPYPAGGVADVITRQLASISEETFDESVIVENATGGGGVTAATQYLSEQPNANNILLGSRSIYVTVPTVQDVDYTFDDIEPVIGIDNVEFILYANPEETGIEDMESLMEYGESNTINYGTAGPGTDIDLIQGGLFSMADVDASAVEYGGGAEGVNNVASGNIDVAMGPPGAGEGLVNDGSVVPIAVASEEPYEGFEDITVPTLKESGYDIAYPGLNFYAVPAGTDEEVVDYLHEEIATMYETDEFQETINNTNLDLKPINSEEISDYIDEQKEVAEELQNQIDSSNE